MSSNSLDSIVATQIWHVTLLVVVVIAVNRWITRRRPHLAHLLWAVVLLKCVTPPIIAAPWSPFGMAGQVMARNEVNAPTRRPLASDGQWVTSDAIWAESKFDSSDPSELHSDVVSKPSVAAKAIEKNGPWPTFIGALWLVWGLGATVATLWLATRCFIQCRQAFRGRIDHDPKWDRAIADLSMRLGIRKRVRLFVTAGNVGPAVIGFWRPTMILPECLVDDTDPKTIEPVLTHELIHVRRGDLWFGAAQWFVQVAWWFHPLVWLGNRRMTRDAEQCCDEEVVAEMGYPPARYARLLIEVLTLKQELKPMSLFPGVRPVDVTSQRLERIMRLGHGSFRRTPKAYWLTTLAFATLVLPGAWIGTTAQDRSSVTSEGESTAPPDAKGVEVALREFDGQVQKFTFEVATPVEGDEAKAATPPPRQFLKTYSLAEVRERLEEAGMGIESLVPALKRADRRSDSSFANIHPGAANAGLARDPNPPQYLLTADKQSLVASHTREGHDRIAEMIGAMGRFGFSQMVIETRVLKLTPEAIEKMGVQWKLVSGKSEPLLPKLGARHDSSPPTLEDGHVSTAAFTVEQKLPVLYATLDGKGTRAFLDKIESNADGAVVRAPRVTVFNGQVAHLADVVERPFVVGLQKSEDGSGHIPQIRVVENGWRLAVRGINRIDSVYLACNAKFSLLRGVDTQRLPVKLDGEQVALQVPEVACSQVNVAMSVPDGQTLLLYAAGAKPKETRIVMLTPTRIKKTEPRDQRKDRASTPSRYERFVLAASSVVESEDQMKDPPTDDQILRLCRRGLADAGVEVDENWDNVRIVREKIASYIDPKRVYPLIGAANLHHTHYKCTLTYHTSPNEDAPNRQVGTKVNTEVIYIDLTHLMLAEGS